MRVLLLFVLLASCSDRRPAAEAPFITCPASDVADIDTGEWIGTATELIAPPGTFARELAGEPVEVGIEGASDDKLFVSSDGVRDDGGLYAIVVAESTDIRDVPLRVTIGPSTYVVFPAINQPPTDVDHSPPIVEDPDEWMSFAANLDEPLELGAFFSISTREMIELPVGAHRIDARLEGHEGHKAIVGLRLESGERCFNTPCGCSETLRAAGLCGAPPPTAPSDPPI